VTAKRSITVSIAGQPYSIRSDADEGYVNSLARLVDGKIREVQRGAKYASRDAVAVLAALQLADELERERRRRGELREKVRVRTRQIGRMLDRAVKS
jgi:cell division protein ZapA